MFLKNCWVVIDSDPSFELQATASDSAPAPVRKPHQIGLA